MLHNCPPEFAAHLPRWMWQGCPALAARPSPTARCSLPQTALLGRRRVRRPRQIRRARAETAASRGFYPIPRSFKGLNRVKPCKTRISRGLVPRPFYNHGFRQVMGQTMTPSSFLRYANSPTAVTTIRNLGSESFLSSIKERNLFNAAAPSSIYDSPPSLTSANAYEPSHDCITASHSSPVLSWYRLTHPSTASI